MTEPAGERARAFFEDLWRRGDPWQLEASEYDQSSYRQQMALISDRRYARALEIGCGAGSFTRRLASICDHVLAVDVSPTAIAAANDAAMSPGVVEFRAANVMEMDDLGTDGGWDLIVLSETIYYLGWLYSAFEVWFLARRLFDATAAGGRLLMTNTWAGPQHYLQDEGLLRTYRDMFVNAGYRVEREAVSFLRLGGRTPVHAAVSSGRLAELTLERATEGGLGLGMVVRGSCVARC